MSQHLAPLVGHLNKIHTIASMKCLGGTSGTNKETLVTEEPLVTDDTGTGGEDGGTLTGISQEFLENHYESLKAMLKDHEQSLKKKTPNQGSKKKLGSVARRIEYSSTSEDEGEDDEDDLNAPYQSDYTSKFTKRIASFSTSKKAKMPSIVRTYDGSGDPDDHLAIFSGAADTEGWPMPIWCRMFSQTLVGPARVWFGELEEGSIDSFKELKKKFERYFMQQRRYTKGPTDIAKIKQRDNEGLRAFL